MLVSLLYNICFIYFPLLVFSLSMGWEKNIHFRITIVYICSNSLFLLQENQKDESQTVLEYQEENINYKSWRVPSICNFLFFSHFPRNVDCAVQMGAIFICWLMTNKVNFLQDSCLLKSSILDSWKGRVQLQWLDKFQTYDRWTPFRLSRDT